MDIDSSPPTPFDLQAGKYSRTIPPRWFEKERIKTRAAEV
jgi:hypothetical protein